MLTKKQLDLLCFIQEKWFESGGVPPSFEEMRKALKLRSKSGIHRLIKSLEERGFIRRLPNRARAIEVIRFPNSTADTKHFESGASDLSTKSVSSKALHSSDRLRGSTLRVSKVDDVPRSDFVNTMLAIPVVGRIAAGSPLTEIEHCTGKVMISKELLPKGDFYGLEVRGDSMDKAGIFSGDIVIIRRQDHANDGDIIVAMIDHQETTLKRYWTQGTQIKLEPANSAYPTRTFDSNRVKIQGCLVTLIRYYQ